MGKGTLAAAFSLSIVATLVTVDAQVGSRRLTVDDIYSPSRRVNFSGAVDTGITWLDASTYLTRRRTANGVEWMKVDAASGRHLAVVRCRPDGGRARVASGRDARRSGGDRALERLTFNPARTGALVTIADDLYFYSFSSAKADRLTTAVRRGGGPDLQPGWATGGVRARQQPARRRHRVAARAGAHDRWNPRDC